MTRKRILGIVRHVLTTVGGFIVGKGYLDAALMPELIGGIMSVTGVIWSIYSPEKKDD